MTTTTGVEAFRADPLEVAERDIERFSEQLPELPDEFLLVRGRLTEIIRRAKELTDMLDAQVMVPYVKARGEIVVAPGVRWVLKVDKTIKPRSLRGAIEGLYEATGGDFDGFVDCLSVNAIKPGAARKVLGEKFDVLFETSVKEDVELRQPKKSLALVNDNFVK